jgi:Rad3-related DNA helicase
MHSVDIQHIEKLVKLKFPFPTANPGQLEAIVFAVDSFLNGTRHVILDLPTGIGKSAVAQTVHNVIKELHPAHRSTIITATKGLQNQYVHSVSGVYDLKGKTNYSCPLGHGFYGAPKCKQACGGKICNPKGQCPYVIRREEWVNNAQLRLTNNAFFCAAPYDLIGDSSSGKRAQLCIIDECHELENSVIDAAAIDLDLTNIMSNIKETNKLYAEPILELIGAIYETFGKSPFKNTIPILQDLINASMQGPMQHLANLKKKVDAGDTGLQPQLDEVDEVVGAIRYLLNADEGEWIVTDYEKLKKIVIKPVYAATVAQQVVYSKSDFFLHMSATIIGAQQYATTMGIPDNTWKYMGVDNPIPVGQRLVKVIKGLAVGAKFTEWTRYYTLIDKLLTKHHNQNGVIHTVSHDLAKKIHENLSKANQRRVLVSSNTNDIMNHLSSVQNAVVISPSIEKGYDFKDDLSRFQIVAKVPYGYLGDPHIKLNMERNSKWYARNTIMRLVQMCGRSVRGVNDYATTYVVDENFLKLTKSNYDLFPEWFTESIQVLN